MKLRTHQFGGNFEEIEEREINKMATKAINISVPDWMWDYIKEHNLKPSRLLQDAVCAYKDADNSYYGNGEQSGLRGAIDRLDMAVEARFQEVEARITKLEK